MKCKECENMIKRYPFDEIVDFDTKAYTYCKVKDIEVKPDDKCDLRGSL